MATAHLVVSALVRRDGRILLVCERAPNNPTATWMLPGGQVETGESVLEALGRELVEETGLRFAGEPRVAFVSHVIGPTDSYVALTFACNVEGDPAPDDPDGLVLEAAWVAEADALSRLADVPWYEVAPLAAYLNGGAPGAVGVVDRR